jgi:hypothetical protein
MALQNENRTTSLYKSMAYAREILQNLTFLLSAAKVGLMERGRPARLVAFPRSEATEISRYDAGETPTLQYDDDALWSLWATAGLWVGGGKRAAFSTDHPQDCAQRKGGNRRSRLSTNPQRSPFRAQRRSLFPLEADPPAGERMARHRDRCCSFVSWI